MKSNRVAYLALGVSAFFFILPRFFWFHDSYTLALLAPAVGILMLKRSPASVVLASLFIGCGLYWSSRDIDSCSMVWRGKFVVDKTLGRLERASWGDVFEAALTNKQCPAEFGKYGEIDSAIVELEQDSFQGHELNLFSTPMGNFWLPEHESHTLAWLVWEISVYEVYHSEHGAVEPGDTVVDAGAHVGVFTRYALQHGAKRIIAIEPNPVNIECYKRNYAKEIATGQVTLVEKGVWDKTETLTLSLDSHDSSRPTLMTLPGGAGGGTLTVPVEPLDDMLAELGVEEVDFIKMDIEGAEREALAGAKKTIERSRPSMAICTYHRPQDPVAVPRAALAAYPDYQVETKGFQINQGLTHPKVMFFN